MDCVTRHQVAPTRRYDDTLVFTILVNDEQNVDEYVHSQVISTYTESLDFQLGPKSSRGRGGMGAKVESALAAINGGVPAVVIANGSTPAAIGRIVDGEKLGTLFLRNTEMVQDEAADERAKAVEMACAARAAARQLVGLASEERSHILHEVAKAITTHTDEVTLSVLL